MSGLSKEWGPSRIFIDCTETFLSGNKTGIQRVVRSIVERTDLMSRHEGIPCVPVVAFGKRFYPLSHFPSLQNKSSRRGGILESGKMFYHRVDGFFQRFSSFWISKRKDGEEKTARDRNIGIFPSARDLIKQYGRNALMRLSSIPLRAQAGEPVSPSSGDLLLMSDMFWGIGDPIQAAADFRKRGGVVIPVIHDLIPIRFPEHCNEGAIYAFCKTLPEVIDLASGILTVSRCGARDLEDYLSERFPDRLLSVDFFYPGADMLRVGDPLLPIRAEIERVGSKDPFYLMVGTILPHKGHQVVLEAFETMWNEGFSGKLIILGRMGGKNDKVLRLMRSSRNFGKILFVWHDANDSELNFLYQHTRALIMASYAEGFGLPLVEAMDKAVPVVASDLPVFREIAGDYPVYFSPGAPDDLIRALNEAVKRERSAGEKNDRHWITWDDSIKTLVEKLTGMYEEQRSL